MKNRKYIFVLIILSALLPSQAFPEDSEDKYFCPCRKLYPIDHAKIAFLGRLEKIEETREQCPGFECRNMTLTFRIEEPWRGVPVQGEVRMKTDDTSCGYGFQLSPGANEPTKIGQSFAVFASRQNMTICNSVMMHSSLLKRSNKKTIYFED